MGVRFVSEPHDWGYTINDWRQGNYHHLDWLGFLPVIPAVAGFRNSISGLENAQDVVRPITPVLDASGNVLHPTQLMGEQTLFSGFGFGGAQNPNSVILDLFGGRQSQIRAIPEYSNAINVDLVANEGVIADVLRLPFANNSVNEIVMNNPFIPYGRNPELQLQLSTELYTEASRVLMPDGLIVVNAQRANAYRILPEVLDNYGLVLVRQGSLDPIFEGLTFRKTNGNPINPSSLETWIYLNQ